MSFKHLTILVFFIVQTSIDAYEPYPECLETSEGCAPNPVTTDPPPSIATEMTDPAYCSKDPKVSQWLMHSDGMMMCSLFMNIHLCAILYAFSLPVSMDVDRNGDASRRDVQHNEHEASTLNRVCYHLASLVISIVVILQYIQIIVCPMIYPRPDQNIHFLILLESTILSVVLAYNSREWQHLKCVKNMSALTDPNINIWRELKLETPVINFRIECYGNVDSQSHPHAYTAEESIPYSSWWVGDDISDISDDGVFDQRGDSKKLNSRSQTYISTAVGTAQNKFTFLSLKYSKKAADEYTQNVIDKAKTDFHELNIHRDKYCRVTDYFGPVKGIEGVEYSRLKSPYIEKHTFKPENMKIPLFCRPWFFWLFTVLPFPFFNGVLLRLIITKLYSVEIRKPIVQYIEILPGFIAETVRSGVIPVPVMDVSRGYQVTQSVVDLVEQKYGSNKVDQS